MVLFGFYTKNGRSTIFICLLHFISNNHILDLKLNKVGTTEFIYLQFVILMIALIYYHGIKIFRYSIL